MIDFREEPLFLEFAENNYEMLDSAIHSLYAQWKVAMKEGKKPVFDIPTIDAMDNEPPKGFQAEVIERVEGAGIIKTVIDKVSTETFAWKVLDTGHITVATKSKEKAEALDTPTLEACIELVQEHYDGKKIEINTRMRDHFYTLYTGVKDEEKKEKE